METEDYGDAITAPQDLPEQTIISHDKQFFIFSTAGKPIYSYKGSEESLSEMMATAKALMSVAQSKSESLRYVRRGRHVIAFLDRSPLYLVAVSLLAEPPPVLRMQLALMHGQIASLLTASALTSIFSKSPGFDARKLLGGGANSTLNSLAASFTSDAAALLGAYPTVPMMRGVRVATLQALRNAMQSTGCLFGLIVGAGAVVGVVSAGRLPLQQWDVLLVLNFLRSNESLKRAETFTPLCLPSFNPNGHLHAYIHYLEASTDTAVVLFAGSGAPDFHALSAARQEMVESLTDNGALQALLDACAAQSSENQCLARLENIDTALEDTRLSVIAAGSILHFAYKLSRPQQFIASPWRQSVSPELHRTCIVAYSQVRAGMFDHAGEHVTGPLQTFRYEARHSFVIVALSGADAELYLTLDPLVSKTEGARIGGEVLRWLQSRHAEWFFPP